MKELKAQIQKEMADAYVLFGQIQTIKQQAEQQLGQLNNELNHLNFSIKANSEKLKELEKLKEADDGD